MLEFAGIHDHVDIVRSLLQRWYRRGSRKYYTLFQSFIKAIADQLIHQLRGQEIRPRLSLHRAEFDHIHTYDGRACANFAEEIEQLIPVKSAGFGRSYSRHLTGVERVEVNCHIGMLAETFPWNDGSSFCKLVAPHNCYVRRSFHELGFFG